MRQSDRNGDKPLQPASLDDISRAARAKKGKRAQPLSKSPAKKHKPTPKPASPKVSQPGQSDVAVGVSLTDQAVAGDDSSADKAVGVDDLSAKQARAPGEDGPAGEPKCAGADGSDQGTPPDAHQPVVA